jgi:hypothetical protein
MSCRFLVHALGISRTIQFRFSNRLLLRLLMADATIEALLGIAFCREVNITAALATIQQAFAPQ